MHFLRFHPVLKKKEKKKGNHLSWLYQHITKVLSAIAYGNSEKHWTGYITLKVLLQTCSKF